MCPSGWHIPSDAEWQELIDTLGGYKVAGGKLKSIEGWVSPNTDATNEYCFSALPGNGRFATGSFGGKQGVAGAWWTATSGVKPNSVFNYVVHNYSGNILRDMNYPAAGYSCRCVKD